MGDRQVLIGDIDRAALLFHTSPLDPLVFAAVGLVVLAMAVVSTLLRARRAAGVDAIISLRSE